MTGLFAAPEMFGLGWMLTFVGMWDDWQLLSQCGLSNAQVR